MNTGVIVTCFMCGKSLSFLPESKEVPVELKNLVMTKEEKFENSENWVSIRVLARRRRERILQGLAAGKSRKAIAKANNCSKSLVADVARQNGFRVCRKREINAPGLYIGRPPRGSASRTGKPN